MPYTRKRTRRSRAYRTYRRRYYRYARRSRIPKAIGTSSANYFSASFTVNQYGGLDFDPQTNHAHTYVFISPFASRFMQPWLLTAAGDWSGVFGLYNSYAFRKYLTMYQSFKIKGIYLTVSIPETNTLTENGVNVYFVWDRQTTVQQAAKYKAGYVASATVTDIRQQCYDQGIMAKRLYPGKGRSTVRTKCIARSSMEKTGWIDTSTYYHQGTSTYNGTTYYTNDFQVQYWRDNPTIVAFSPGCWMAVETLNYNIQNSVQTIPCEIQMRVYCDFRNPGGSYDATTTKDLLLKPNIDLMAWTTTKDGTKIIPNTPNDSDIIVKRNREPDEEDMCAQPAIKAVEHEELPDEEETSTQLL